MTLMSPLQHQFLCNFLLILWKTNILDKDLYLLKISATWGIFTSKVASRVEWGLPDSSALKEGDKN